MRIFVALEALVCRDRTSALGLTDFLTSDSNPRRTVSSKELSSLAVAASGDCQKSRATSDGSLTRARDDSRATEFCASARAQKILYSPRGIAGLALCRDDEAFGSIVERSREMEKPAVPFDLIRSLANIHGFSLSGKTLNAIWRLCD